MISGIKKLTDKPIKYLVNTHSDGDHVSGNRYFPATVAVIAQENCRKEMLLPGRTGGASEWSKPEQAGFVPGLTFSERMDVYLGSDKVELYYFGVGHTTGDIVVYFPEEKTAFIGDQIFIGRTQLIHSYKGGNSHEHVKTLARMLETLGAERFCSGHSPMTDRQGIKNHMEQMQSLQAKVKALKAAGKSVAEAQKEFSAEQAQLVGAIYNEIKDKA